MQILTGRRHTVGQTSIIIKALQCVFGDSPTEKKTQGTWTLLDTLPRTTILCQVSSYTDQGFSFYRNIHTHIQSLF